MITWHMMLTWYRTPTLICYTWHQHLICYIWLMISDTGTWHVILDTWYLSHDIWHRYLTCHNLTPDTWLLLYNTWRLTCYHSLHMVLVHLTWYCDTWLETIVPNTLCIFITITFTGLGMIIILLPDIWYSCILNPCNRETPDIMLLILYSCWSP